MWLKLSRPQIPTIRRTQPLLLQQTPKPNQLRTRAVSMTLNMLQAITCLHYRMTLLTEAGHTHSWMTSSRGYGWPTVPTSLQYHVHKTPLRMSAYLSLSGFVIWLSEKASAVILGGDVWSDPDNPFLRMPWSCSSWGAIGGGRITLPQTLLLQPPKVRLQSSPCSPTRLTHLSPSIDLSNMVHQPVANTQANGSAPQRLHHASKSSPQSVLLLDFVSTLHPQHQKFTKIVSGRLPQQAPRTPRSNRRWYCWGSDWALTGSRQSITKPWRVHWRTRNRLE